ncbi:protein-(Glutamine-N5) methyltransferase [Prevotella sp. CAG:255]|jgi:release factor glutamine methyltransferase|uniref:peptide chain release factor N(5)-glutamine methyltransferase n=1 Tax=Prevotella sp. CAG:255 TaxID=1262923 RepID=UPI0003357715|nr:peptide chain release factor N(5)-glutamine methyltransferase [Prevotella sp. CAG:255]CCX69073.1 protein-(Glutamine-N5) methyltransferase [Prevotella sp. CAG:255]
MTYRELWRTLEPLYGNGEARAITDYVLDVCFGLSKADILCGAVEEMTAEKTAELNKIFGRLTEGEPVQYVLGRAEFCGRWFSVRPGVLIPRPETEELCAWITADSKASASPKVLDIGTGSGCIAITLQLDMPESKVTAWDISADALDVARENAQQLGANVNFVKLDALNAKPEGEWDVIVSNPPYICEKEKKDMAVNVLEHEPHTALFVPDADPLLFYRAITRLAVQTLSKGGRLYFEINPIYADDTCHMMRAEGMTAVELRSDMYGKQRMAKGVKA